MEYRITNMGVLQAPMVSPCHVGCHLKNSLTKHQKFVQKRKNDYKPPKDVQGHCSRAISYAQPFQSLNNLFLGTERNAGPGDEITASCASNKIMRTLILITSFKCFDVRKHISIFVYYISLVTKNWPVLYISQKIRTDRRRKWKLPWNCY